MLIKFKKLKLKQGEENKENIKMRRETILYQWEYLKAIEKEQLLNGNYDGKASSDLYYFIKRTLVDMLRKDINVYNYLPSELKDCDIIQDAIWDIMTEKHYITSDNKDEYYHNKYLEQVEESWKQLDKQNIKQEDEARAFSTFIPECVETGVKSR